jgi:putative phosphoribosyl transferase
MNKRTLEFLTNAEAKELVIIPGATHLFEEPGKMEEVAQIAADWFECYLLETSKFYNKYTKIPRTKILSSFWNRYRLQIKFRDRSAAGDILASMLYKYKDNQGQDSVTIIGIARGGIIVAKVIAEKLNAHLDIIVPRKLRSPYDSEKAIGAIMHDGSVYLDKSILETQHNISEEYIDMEKLEKKKEMEVKLNLYRPHAREYKIKDRVIILVDDGIATGATMIAAARWIRKHQPKSLVMTSPVAPKEVVKHIKEEADQTVIIRNPVDFKAVEQFYHEFGSVSDQQIIEIMKRNLSY